MGLSFRLSIAMGSRSALPISDSGCASTSKPLLQKLRYPVAVTDHRSKSSANLHYCRASFLRRSGSHRGKRRS